MILWRVGTAEVALGCDGTRFVEADGESLLTAGCFESVDVQALFVFRASTRRQTPYGSAAASALVLTPIGVSHCYCRTARPGGCCRVDVMRGRVGPMG